MIAFFHNGSNLSKESTVFFSKWAAFFQIGSHSSKIGHRNLPKLDRKLSIWIFTFFQHWPRFPNNRSRFWVYMYACLIVIHVIFLFKNNRCISSFCILRTFLFLSFFLKITVHFSEISPVLTIYFTVVCPSIFWIWKFLVALENVRVLFIYLYCILLSRHF